MAQAPTVALSNPLREERRGERLPQACNMVIFGASGDLTHRKLFPALYNLALEHLVPAELCVIGYARRPKEHQEFRDEVKGSVNQFSRRKPVREDIWRDFEKGVFYVPATFEDPEGYQRLQELMRKNDQERGTGGNRLYYLATPPRSYADIIRNLREIEGPSATDGR
ncbi:MAG: glucose-6-phosphate dehydrogenase, partial [Chloroflexota bacterium]|nr:glucose-6-phosphate dehydrogenase [Chloroflexota bacterium]